MLGECLAQTTTRAGQAKDKAYLIDSDPSDPENR
jgi:hypothetical protein